MKYLFVHQNFPGQYLHICRHLAASGQHEIIFLTEENPNFLGGVRKIVHAPPPGNTPSTNRDLREMEMAVQRAQIVAQGCTSLKDLGFVPDIVIGHHGWGEMLNIKDVWPPTSRCSATSSSSTMSKASTSVSTRNSPCAGNYSRACASRTPSTCWH